MAPAIILQEKPNVEEETITPIPTVFFETFSSYDEDDLFELRPEFLEKMRKARKEHLKGEFISLEDVEKKLGLR